LYQLNLALNTDFNKEPLSNNQLKVLDKMVWAVASREWAGVGLWRTSRAIAKLV
jgi:hypothetical protein